jgi:oligoribonuclease
LSNSIENQPLVWMDLEMTGLDPEKEGIIELATIITDSHLNIIAQGPVIAVSQSIDLLSNMDEWNTRTHNASGLVQRVLDSTVTLAEAEQMTLSFIELYVKKGTSPLCGNSIHQDRRFLVKYMSTLERHFHYRNIDVSTVKELAQRWKPELLKGLTKKGTHQALDDIIESIEELKYFREHFFDMT